MQRKDVSWAIPANLVTRMKARNQGNCVGRVQLVVRLYDRVKKKLNMVVNTLVIRFISKNLIAKEYLINLCIIIAGTPLRK